MVESPRTVEERKKKEALKAQLKCPQDHKIVVYQNGFKRRVGPEGQVI